MMYIKKALFCVWFLSFPFMGMCSNYYEGLEKINESTYFLFIKDDDKLKIEDIVGAFREIMQDSLYNKLRKGDSAFCKLRNSDCISQIHLKYLKLFVANNYHNNRILLIVPLAACKGNDTEYYFAVSIRRKFFLEYLQNLEKGAIVEKSYSHVNEDFLKKYDGYKKRDFKKVGVLMLNKLNFSFVPAVPQRE